MNCLQRLIVKEILQHIMQFLKRFCHKRKNQLLFYIRDKNDVEKNRIMQALCLNFALLKKEKKLIVCVLTDCAIDEIDDNTINTTFNIDTSETNRLKKNMNAI